MRSQILSKFLNHHGFVIGPVADIHLRNGIPFEDDEVSADANRPLREGGFAICFLKPCPTRDLPEP